MSKFRLEHVGHHEFDEAVPIADISMERFAVDP
jgi:hypothetical protein